MEGHLPKRVLQVIGSLGLGGAEAMITNIYRALDHNQVQFDFVVFEEDTGGFEADVRSLGGRVIRTASPSRGHAATFVRALTRLIQENGPYVAVHSHVNFASAPVLLAAAITGVPCRVAHAHIAGPAQQSLSQFAYTRTSRIVLARTATDFLGCGQLAGRYVFGRRWKSHGRVIPNAIDVDRFANAPSDSTLRDRLGIAQDALFLGSIARLSPQKNHAFLLELMASPAMNDLPAHLAIVGRGELQTALERKIDKLGIRDRVHLVGPRHDIPSVMKTLDYMILPSLYEGLPVVLVEAQAALLPSLVSNHVTTEVDLGLGLVEYLPLDLDAWVKRLQAPKPNIPTHNEVLAALQGGGYVVDRSVDELLRVYGLA
ncbi:glycosyltransferase [Ornithinimicrobium cryptoxanthini]|uniref:glycosyltransferase n=1 Tax=Ornithinimicrobium cryptoxanthini TaxID=2934161 RepID=UPI0021185FE6|nr:glycosyltransferase [Ornithinimicrobium cryptoxanthini]